MNKFETIIANLERFKHDMYGFNRQRPHQYVAIRLVKYLNSEPLILSIIEEWKNQLEKDRKRAEKFFSFLKDKLIGFGFIPSNLMDKFKENYSWFTEKKSFKFPDRILNFATDTNLYHFLDFDDIFAKMKNPNIQIDKEDLLKTYKLFLLELIESDEYLTNELRWLRSSLSDDKENLVGLNKILEFFYYYTDPLETAQNNIHLNEDDYRESSLGIIGELIQEFQNRSLVNYWIDRYCQRSQHFNRIFYSEISNKLEEKDLKENHFCMHLLLYLFDQGIEFSYNQVKQGFRPDIELTNSVIEVKYIRKNDAKSVIRNAINKAITEVYLQSQSHPSTVKHILIFNANRNFRLIDCEYEDILFRSVDLGIALFNDFPSKSKREILKLSELLKRV